MNQLTLHDTQQLHMTCRQADTNSSYTALHIICRPVDVNNTYWNKRLLASLYCVHTVCSTAE